MKRSFQNWLAIIMLHLTGTFHWKIAQTATQDLRFCASASDKFNAWISNFLLYKFIKLKIQHFLIKNLFHSWKSHILLSFHIFEERKKNDAQALCIELLQVKLITIAAIFQIWNFFELFETNHLKMIVDGIPFFRFIIFSCSLFFVLMVEFLHQILSKP